MDTRLPDHSYNIPIEITDAGKDLPLVESHQQEIHQDDKLKKGASKTIAAIATYGMVNTAPLVATTALLLGGIDAASKMLDPNRTTLWDEAISRALLPAGFRPQLTKPPETDKIKHFKVDVPGGPELDGMVYLAEGLDNKTAVKMPTVVLFCQNSAMMEEKSKEAKQYQDKGFNVVVFNYRGVGGSSGKVMCADDLFEDGMAVVNQLRNGIVLDKDTDSPFTLQTKSKNIFLDGTSIGGAVAAHVSKELPKTRCNIGRSFKDWDKAAKGVGMQISNPVIATLGEKALKSTGRTKMDNVKAIKTRLSDPKHGITIIEDAGEKGDRVLTEDAKLTAKVMQRELDRSMTSGDVRLYGQTFISRKDSDSERIKYDHNTFIPLEERTHVMNLIVAPHQQSFEGLKKAEATQTRILGYLDIEKGNHTPSKALQAYVRLTQTKGALGKSLVEHLKELEKLANQDDNNYSDEIKEMLNEVASHRDELLDAFKDELTKDQVKTIKKILKHIIVIA